MSDATRKLTDPDEFMQFHLLLTKDHPEYVPHYIRVNGGDTVERNEAGQPVDKDDNPVSEDSPKRINLGKKSAGQHKKITVDAAIRRLKRGENVGIAAREDDDLVIIDVDDPEAVRTTELKPTLTIMSRSRDGYHYFYHASDPTDERVLKNTTITGVGEIRAWNYYAVAPGSWVDTFDIADEIPHDQVENAGEYTIEDAVPVAQIGYEELPKAFRDHIEKGETENQIALAMQEERKRKREERGATGREYTNDSALFQLTMFDVIGEMPEPGERIRNPVDPGSDGASAAISEKDGQTYLQCFSYGVSLTTLEALAVLAGVTDCASAGRGHKGSTAGASTINYGDGRTWYMAWAYAKRRGMIPKDDPIASHAVRWYATDQGITNAKKVQARIDAGEMPLTSAEYNQTLALIEAEEKIPSGRRKLLAPGATALSAMGDALEKKIDTIDIAEKMQKTNPIIYDKTKQFWIWDEKKKMWFAVDETDVFNALRRVASIRGGVVGNARSTYLQAIKLTGRELDVKEPDVNWVAFADYVVDIRTDEKFEATKEYMFTNTIPHKYGDTPDTPTIDRIFGEWVGNEHVDLLYEILAYCLYNGLPIHRTFLLLGSGRNGKGQFMHLVRKFLGTENTVSTRLKSLIESRFETAKLYRKKAALMPETEFKNMDDTSMFKQFTGGDLADGERKYGTPFNFINTAKMIIGSNSVPASNDKSEGYGSRWIIIDFPNKFEISKPIIDTIPEREYENLCRRLVKTLRNLLERGMFKNEGDTSARAKRYEDKSNPIQFFIEMECDVAGNLSIPLWKFVEAYDIYQTEHRLRTLTKKAISKWLSEHGYETVLENIDDETGRHNWVIVYGLELKTIVFTRETRETRQLQTVLHKEKSVENTRVSRVSRAKNTKPIRAGSVQKNGHAGLGTICSDCQAEVDTDRGAQITEIIIRLGRDSENHEFTVVNVLLNLPKKRGFTTEEIERFMNAHSHDLKIERRGGGMWRQAIA